MRIMMVRGLGEEEGEGKHSREEINSQNELTTRVKNVHCEKN